MLDRLTRLQLSIFAIVTVLTVGAIAILFIWRRIQASRQP